MFRKFRELFSTESLLDQAYNTTVSMLEFDLEMYEVARNSLRNEDNADLPYDVKKADRKINKYEREVRRDVVTHLTVAGTANLVAGLALTSIVIDVERIGDYTKNIVELADMHPTRLHGGQFEEDLVELEKRVEYCFPMTIQAIKDQDKAAGRKVMQGEDEMGKRSDRVVEQVITFRDLKMTAGEGAAVALYARYLKRINAHLTNVASAIVNPFPRIGFREKTLKKPKKTSS